MKVVLFKAWSNLDKCWTYHLDIEEPSIWSQWLWYGIGSALKNKKVNLYPYPPFKTEQKIKILKSYKGERFSATWYGEQIGKTILKDMGQK